MATALVTGCSSGFGAATAVHFARRGVRVFASVRSLERGAALAEAATAEDLPISLVVLDLDDEASCTRAVDAVLAAAGSLDVLVNNAGRVLYAPVEETADAEVAALFETNLHGALRLIRAVLPAMRARGTGAIVNVSSVNGLVNLPFSGIYGATKWALEGVSQALWLELAPYGIRVAVVQPSGFDTAIADNAVPVSLPSPSSPYWEGLERARRSSWAANAANPDLTPVAEAIWSAAFGPERRFRWPVGIHAELLTDLTRQRFDIDLLDTLHGGIRAALDEVAAARAADGTG